jgi:hypothetical protein
MTEVGEKRWLNVDASIRDKFLLETLTMVRSLSGQGRCSYAMIYYKSNDVEDVLEVQQPNAEDLGSYLDTDLNEGSQYIFAKYNYTPSKIFLSETNNGLKNSCLYNIIYNATVESFSKRFENYNHEFFQRHILKSDTYKTENIGLSISKTVECICKKYNVAISVITKEKKQVCKYVPEKARAIKDLPRSINIMVEGKHAYPINNNILEFAHKEFTDVIEEQVNTNEGQDEYITMSFDKDDQKIRIEFAKTVEDILELIRQAARSETNEKVRISTFASLENLSIKLKYDCDYTPKITYDSSCTMVTSVSVFFSDKEQMITICKPDIDPVNKNENNEFVSNVEELRKYEDAKEKLYDEIFKIKYSSYYGDQEDIDKEQLYPIAPVIDQWEKFEVANGLDYNKYYAYIASEMTQQPVFEVFDNWQPYDGSKIEKHSMYIVNITNSLGGYKSAFFKTGKARVFGLEILQGIVPKHEVIEMKIPSMIQPVNFKTIIQQTRNTKICEDEKQNSGTIKRLINVMIGNLERKKVNKEYQQVFTDKKQYKNEISQSFKSGYKIDEVNEVKQTVNFGLDEEDVDQEIIKYEKTGRSLYIVSNTNTKYYLNGFKYIKELLYSISRCLMMRICEKLENNNVKIYGIKTDSVYFDAKQTDLVKSLFPISDKIGEFKIETDKKNIKRME